MGQESFPRAERLKSRKLIEQVFREGKSKLHYPILYKWILRDPKEEDPSTLLGVSVPKRRVPRAVDRNRIKRQMREAYRRHKPLRPSATSQLICMAIYLGDRSSDYEQIVQSFTRWSEAMAHP